MKKLRLKLDALQVETFQITATSAARRGTVQANSYMYTDTGCGQSVVTLCGTCAGDLGCPPSAAVREDS